MSRTSVAILTGLLGAITHALFQNNLLSYIPWPLFTSTVIVWIIPTPWSYLALVALFSELFTTLPPGIMTGVVFMPALAWRLRGRIEVDVSFSFLALLLLTTLVQVLTLAAADSIWQGIAVVAWQDRAQLIRLGAIGLATTLATFAAILVFDTLLPTRDTSSLPYHGRSYHRRTF